MQRLLLEARLWLAERLVGQTQRIGGNMPKATAKSAFEKWKTSVHYVQFSKRVIQWINIGLFTVLVLGMVFCYKLEYPQGIVSIVLFYIGYCMTAFAFYSGNSAWEKTLIKKGGGLIGSELTNNTNVSGEENTEKEDTNG
jgi:hypothetical protein